jgi:hypothetical protein
MQFYCGRQFTVFKVQLGAERHPAPAAMVQPENIKLFLSIGLNVFCVLRGFISLCMGMIR